jgi:hypothetical protein
MQHNRKEPRILRTTCGLLRLSAIISYRAILHARVSLPVTEKSAMSAISMHVCEQLLPSFSCEGSASRKTAVCGLQLKFLPFHTVF